MLAPHLIITYGRVDLARASNKSPILGSDLLLLGRPTGTDVILTVVF